MRARLSLFAVAASALLLAATLPARAAVVDALDLAALVRLSEHVLVVDVVQQSARWDARGRIVTDVELSVVESMKGPHRAGETVVLTRLGGAIGDLGMRVEGEPGFVDGERDVVFARTGAEDHVSLRPVGMSQGVMRVVTGVVQPGGGGLSLVRRAPDGSLRAATGALVAPRPLATLRDDVHALLEASR